MINKRFVPIASIIIIFILTLIYVKPKFFEVIKMREENKNIKKSSASITKKAQTLESIDKDEILRKVKLIEEIFPSQQPIIDLINSLENLSAEEDVLFDGIELKPGRLNEEDKDPNIHNLVIEYKLAGNLAKLSSVVRRLETTPPIMKIEKIDLSLLDKKESTQSSMLAASLTVNVYYQRIPETIGALDSALPMLTNEETELINKLADFHIPPKVQPVSPTGKEDLFTPL